ncbi:MAG: VanZ family protein [Planctomycetota bacterium]
MIRLPSRILALALLVGWTALIWWLMTGARVSVGERTWWGLWARNMTHAPLFGVHAALAALVVRPGRVPGPVAGERSREGRAEHRAFLVGVAVAVAYGLLVEWRQASLPRRVASGYDLLTDAVGALGVPWALATGALFSKRAVVVFVLAAAVSAAAAFL